MPCPVSGCGNSLYDYRSKCFKHLGWGICREDGCNNWVPNSDDRYTRCDLHSASAKQNNNNLTGASSSSSSSPKICNWCSLPATAASGYHFCAGHDAANRKHNENLRCQLEYDQRREELASGQAAFAQQMAFANQYNAAVVARGSSNRHREGGSHREEGGGGERGGGGSFMNPRLACQVEAKIVKDAIDLRSTDPDQYTRPQRKLINDLVHANDDERWWVEGSPTRKKLPQNPYYGPDDKTLEAIEAIKNAGLGPKFGLE